MNSYPEYKDSGHSLIGLVPKPWVVVPNGAFFKEKSIKKTDNEQNLSVYRDYGVIPRDSREDNHNKVSEDISNYKLVDVGDFVLNKMKCWMGSLGVSDYRGIVSPSYTVCEPIREINRRYFHYLLRSEPYIQIYNSLSYGVRIGQWELRFHDFKTIKALYPSIPEQTLIAEYLDKKTSQIDTLVEKIERKIELLKEQRTALINQCVTKGLDPDVEMKDSGVEWIGGIPKHWNVKNLKHVSDCVNGFAFKSEDFDKDSDIPVIRIGDIDTPIDFDSCVKLPFKFLDRYSEFTVKKGEILIGLTGGTIGKYCLYDYDNPSLINQRVCSLISRDSFDPDFLYLFVSPFLFKHQIDFNCYGGGQPNIGKDDLMNFFLATPPKQEQTLIAEYLDKKVSQIDTFVENHQAKINLLKEYRQSLISNVVTGKVMVTEDMV